MKEMTPEEQKAAGRPYGFDPNSLPNDCVINGKKIYHWNDKTEKVDVYTCESVSVDKCPKDILVQLMHKLKSQGKKVQIQISPKTTVVKPA